MAAVDKAQKAGADTAAESVTKLTQALPSLGNNTVWRNHDAFIANTRALMASLSIADLRALVAHVDEVDEAARSYFLEVAPAGADKEARATHLQKFESEALRTWAETARKIFYLMLARAVREKTSQTIRVPKGIELSEDTLEQV